MTIVLIYIYIWLNDLLQFAAVAPHCVRVNDCRLPSDKRLRSLFHYKILLWLPGNKHRARDSWRTFCVGWRIPVPSQKEKLVLCFQISIYLKTLLDTIYLLLPRSRHTAGRLNIHRLLYRISLRFDSNLYWLPTIDNNRRNLLISITVTRIETQVTHKGITYLLLTYLLACLLTYSMEQSPSWEANLFSASQEISRILWNPKVHYLIHKCPPSVAILSQLDAVSHKVIILCNIQWMICGVWGLLGVLARRVVYLIQTVIS